ncbi:hypothetical protein ES708_04563 [subsurface metagenome]
MPEFETDRLEIRDYLKAHGVTNEDIAHYEKVIRGLREWFLNVSPSRVRQSEFKHGPERIRNQQVR